MNYLIKIPRQKRIIKIQTLLIFKISCRCR